MIDNLKIAYIGGGSRGWARGLMSDLATAEDICGEVFLYDIDFDAAKKNEIIGNMFKDAEGAKAKWSYTAVKTIDEALTCANFVIISILPATFSEMALDVHTPEKYGIYQSVGDTTGPGGITRSLRTMPMYEVIAKAIERNCPEAYVINYTNPMAVCVATLYRVFPKIKAFGCCHEVFGTQKLLALVADKYGVKKGATREDIKISVTGVNHFTWITKAACEGVDLFPYYAKFCDEYCESGVTEKIDDNWFNKFFTSQEKVKLYLFKKFGYIAAAGDRHLAEFCPKSWFIESEELRRSFGFELTPIWWREKDLAEKQAMTEKLLSGEEKVKVMNTGEEGVRQMRALLGLEDLVTNVNLPNVGQVENLPNGIVVETNAVFSKDGVKPVLGNPIPTELYPLVARAAGAQRTVVEAGAERDLKKAFTAFVTDPLVGIKIEDAEKLFKEILEGEKAYLTSYKL